MHTVKDFLKTDRESVLSLAKNVVDIEANAVKAMGERIDDSFLKALEILLACSGRIIVTGIGKSGHIGNKLSATLASTGSPAFFVHAAEASHGDIGMMQQGDVVIAISYSGSSDELLAIVPGIKRLGLPLISLCGNPKSALSKASDVTLDISVEREACPLGLAPTASTTCTLVIGDALAVALLRSKGFDENDFARSHPGGKLGRQLLLRVSDVMASGEDMPVVNQQTAVPEVLMEITKKGLGMAAITDKSGHLLGIFTDGDLRRTIDQNLDIRTASIEAVMTAGGHSIEPTTLAVNAVSVMRQHKITALPVLENKKLIGVVTMHALLASGVA